ncbi:MAG TPA: phage holin family protein [Solirubrobacterales bacterium]|nr:phage holin family protein [Solirubrobacterales bacterium]
MATPGATPPPRDPSQKSVGELVFEVTERTSGLIREEIELAKTEVTEKVGKLIRGSIVGAVAGVFAFLALILIMHGIAWLITDLFFDDNVWAGFLIEAAFFLLVAAIAGLVAYKSVQAGAPPTPDAAIEEAKRTRAILEGGGSDAGAATRATTRATVPASPEREDS